MGAIRRLQSVHPVPTALDRAGGWTVEIHRRFQALRGTWIRVFSTLKPLQACPTTSMHPKGL
jgi:hypothetical protein